MGWKSPISFALVLTDGSVKIFITPPSVSRFFTEEHVTAELVRNFLAFDDTPEIIPTTGSYHEPD
jgi:hypothetical protein